VIITFRPQSPQLSLTPTIITVNFSQVGPQGPRDTTTAAALAAHTADHNNPHQVTAAQVGADPAGSATAAQAAAITTAAGDATSKANAAAAASTPVAHASDHANPHQVTASQAGADPAGTAATAVGAEAAARQLAEAGLELRGFQSINRSFMYGSPGTATLRVAETTQFTANAYSSTTKSLTSIVLSRVYGANPKLIFHWMSGSFYPRTVGTWPAITNGTVYASVVLNNILYLAGDFTTVGGVTRNRLAAVDLADNSLTSWNPNSAGKIECLKVWNGNIVVGGTFRTIAGVSRNGLAMLDTTGAATAWNPCQMSTDNLQVHGMDIIGNYLYAGSWMNTGPGYAHKWDLTTTGEPSEVTWNHPANEGNTYTLLVTSVTAFGDYLIYCWESGASASAFHKDTGAKRTWAHGSTTSSIYLCKVIDGNLHIGQTISPSNTTNYAVWDASFNLLANKPASYIGTPYDAVKVGDVVYVANNSGGISAWRWSGNTVYPLAPSCSVTRTLYYASDAMLIFAGSFTTLCGATATRLAAINPADLWHRSPADADNVVWKAKAIKSLTGQLIGAAGAEAEAVVSANVNGGLNTVTLTLVPSGDAVADPGDLAIAFWRDVDDVRDVSLNTAYITALEVSP
jgi:hypothetical protein